MKVAATAGFASILVGVAVIWIRSTGIDGFVRLVLAEAFPSGDEPTHLKRGSGAFRRIERFLPEEDLRRWVQTIHDVGYLTGGYPRRPHPSSFGETFPAKDGTCPFLFEVDESGTTCSLFNHIDLITYQIFVGGHLSLKFSVKGLMAMITQYMIKLKTPVQETQRYNDTTLKMCGSAGGHHPEELRGGGLRTGPTRCVPGFTTSWKTSASTRPCGTSPASPSSNRPSLRTCPSCPQERSFTTTSTNPTLGAWTILASHAG